MPGVYCGGVTGATSPLTGITVDELDPPPVPFAGFTPDTGEGSTSGFDPKVPIPPAEGEDAGDCDADDEDASPAVFGFFVADMTATKAGMTRLETAAGITSLVSDLALFPVSGFPDFNALIVL